MFEPYSFYFHSMKMSVNSGLEYYDAIKLLSDTISEIQLNISLKENQSITTFAQMVDDKFLVLKLEGSNYSAGIYDRHQGGFVPCVAETFPVDLTPLMRKNLAKNIERMASSVETGIVPDNHSVLSRELQKKWDAYLDSIPPELNYMQVDDPRDAIQVDFEQEESEFDTDLLEV